MAFLNANQQQLPTPDASQVFSNPNTGVSTPASYANNTSTWTPPDGLTPSLSTNPSRKRSRDESAFEATGESSYFSYPSTQTVSTPAPIPEEEEVEPIYGEGMVLLNPSTGRALSAESQTGTWFEERAAREADVVAQQKLAAEVAAEEAAKLFRPTLPVSRKSVRLSQSSIRAEMDLAAGAVGAVPDISVPASPPRSAGDRPEADEATIALGIGWTKVSSEDADLQAAARGWAKYIENHYRTIHGAEILLKSRSLNAYLVGAQEGFFLFSEDLLEGKLVGKDWESALQNLQLGHFEGAEVVTAERTPGPEDRKDSGMCLQQQVEPPSVFVNGSIGTANMDLD